MPHGSDEFNLYVWGMPIKEGLTYSGWEMTERLSKESSLYLNSLGYRSVVNIPTPQLGAGGLGIIRLMIESLPDLIPFLKIALLTVKVVTNKYYRAIAFATKSPRPSMEIVMYYKSSSKKWIKEWTPDDSVSKTDSMLEASYYLYIYLKSKYPNIEFRQSVSFYFDHGKSSIHFKLNDSENSKLNLARFKMILRQTSFLSDTSNTIDIKNKLFIRRSEVVFGNGGFESEKKYYFVIPSTLVSELINRSQLLKFKIKNKGSR